jgi:vacuolar-type H+-ATPase subunit H
MWVLFLWRRTVPKHDDLTERFLRNAQTLRVRPQARLKHLNALMSAGALTHSRSPQQLRMRMRRWVATTSVAFVTLAPAAAVAASTDALPGETLYPVKLATEAVWSFIDPDIAAHHRVEELQILLSRGADPSVIDEAIRSARASVAELDPADQLRADLETIVCDEVAEAEDDAAVEQEEVEREAEEEYQELLDEQAEEAAEVEEETAENADAEADNYSDDGDDPPKKAKDA